MTPPEREVAYLREHPRRADKERVVRPRAHVDAQAGQVERGAQRVYDGGSLAQRLTSAASALKHRGAVGMDPDDVANLLRTASSYVTAVSTLIPHARDFSYHRAEDGTIEVRLRAETNDQSLSTLLELLSGRDWC